MDDGRIVELFFGRSEQAVAELSEKYGALCMKIAAGILGDSRDAEECVNDAFLAAWNAMPPERPGNLTAYVCRITRNLALKRYHANTAKKRNSAYDVALEELEGCFPASGSVEEESDAAETAERINGFLKTLDRKSRIMFVRRYWYADTVEEIAARMGTGRHYVSVRLSRTRAALRRYLEKEGTAQ